MRRRALIVVVVAAVVAAIAAYLARPERGVPDDAPTLDAMADAVGADIMEHIHRGHVAGRSGEIMLVPKPHNYLLGEWDLTTLGTANPTTSTSHPNPWAYLARVPIVLYGPGYVESGVEDAGVVDISALAPTYAELLGLQVPGLPSAPLGSALARSNRAAPRAIVTVVVDGGGWNALREHPASHPGLDRLRRRGTTFVNATIGSAPSITAALHATFGTGHYPATHRIPGNQMRGADGKNTDAWLENADPRYLEVPTVSELWDEATGNDAVVATVSYEGWHLGMIGHGAARSGGDKDVAVLWEPEENSWWINEDYYTLPDYLRTTDVATLESYEEALDARDGLEDGAWFGHTLEQLQENLVRPATPAFVRFTGDAVVDILRNEDVGQDEVTDLVWVELKMPDYAGHAWNVVGPEQGDVLLETDRQIARFKAWLDRHVGTRNYVLAISADHGQQPFPDLLGGWRINNKELERDIEDRFGPVVEKVTTVDIFLDSEAIFEAGIDPTDIARYLGTYTLGENIPDGAFGAERVPGARLDELLFAGAFDTDYLQSLSVEKISSFGDSDYAEGDLTSPPGTAEVGSS